MSEDLTLTDDRDPNLSVLHVLLLCSIPSNDHHTNAPAITGCHGDARLTNQTSAWRKMLVNHALKRGNRRYAMTTSIPDSRGSTLAELLIPAGLTKPHFGSLRPLCRSVVVLVEFERQQPPPLANFGAETARPSELEVFAEASLAATATPHTDSTCAAPCPSPYLLRPA